MTNANMYDKERREIICRELESYMAAIGDITAEERRSLCKWAKDGNSVADNPYCYYSVNGNPMDYISALRINEDLIAEHGLC